MAVSDRKSHWENVYSAKEESEVSWFEDSPALSLVLIEGLTLEKEAAIIDVGGGRSRLAGELAARGYGNLTVLDLSASALAAARARMGEDGDRIRWIEGDVTVWEPDARYDLWHDRAAFHFLVDEHAQREYVERLCRAVPRGGYAIIGTFAPDGPQTCSGLPVARHDERSLSGLLAGRFVLHDHRRHEHRTPWGAVQQFQFSTFRRV